MANRCILLPGLIGSTQQDALAMMVAVFASMLLALVAGRYGPSWLALLSLATCLALSVGLFLFEIYSPDYGFRMPWIQT